MTSLHEGLSTTVDVSELFHASEDLYRDTFLLLESVNLFNSHGEMLREKHKVLATLSALFAVLVKAGERHNWMSRVNHQKLSRRSHEIETMLQQIDDELRIIRPLEICSHT